MPRRPIALSYIWEIMYCCSHADVYFALRFASQLHDRMVQNTIQRRLKRAFVPIFVVEKYAEMDGRLTVKFKFSAEIGQLGAQNLLKHPHDQALRLRILRLAGKSPRQNGSRNPY